MTTEHAVQVRTLGPAVVTRFGAVAQRALGMKDGLASVSIGVGVGPQHRCSAQQTGQ